MKSGILFLALAWALLFAAGGCGRHKPEAARGAQPAEKKTIRVKLLEIKPQDFERRITLSASAKASAEVALAAETMARVEKFGFDKGQEVERGTILIWLDAATVRAQVGQAKADRDMVRLDYEKQAALREKGGSVSDYVLEKSRLALEAAEARIRGLETLMAKYVLAAPISGVVASRDVEVGMVVAPGAPLARIIAVRPIKVALGVPELDIGAVAIGGKVRVTFDALPDRVYEGVVSYVGAEVNKAARVFDAEIILPNQDKSIRPEMSAKAVFTGGKVKNAVVIPQTAVVELATGHMAFIVGPDNIAHMRAIEVTDYSEGRALIKSGLAAGDRLVILGHRDLIDGDKVEIGE